MKNTKNRITKHRIEALELKFNSESISHIKPRSIGFDNFFEHTFARFIKIEKVPNREPNYISTSGSKYWNMGNYVIRYSDHWGKAQNCYWYLSSEYSALFQTASAMCRYSDFIDLVYLMQVDSVVHSLTEKEINKHNLYRAKHHKLSVIRKRSAYQLVYKCLKEQCNDFLRPALSEKLGNDKWLVEECFIRGVSWSLY